MKKTTVPNEEDPNRDKVVKPPFKASAERQRLVERMLELKEDEVLTYPEIQKLIVEDPQSQRGYNIIQSAKKVLRDEHRRNFVTIKKIGVKWTNAPDTAEHAGTVVVSIRRKVKFGKSVVQCVSTAELSHENKTQFQLTNALLQLVDSAVSNEMKKTVKTIIAQSEDPKVGSNVLQLFKVPPPPKKEANG